MDNRERIAQLAQQAAKGSQQAFNELYLLTRDRAYFVAFSITKNEQDALDILQDSYLKAWQKCAGLENPAAFTAWLSQIVGNTAKSFIKRGKPQLFLRGADDETDPLDLQEEKDGDYIPAAAMDTAETRRLVMEIVDGLPEDQRLCVLMYYYEDMGLPEIARALDVPQSTVTSRLHLARKKISRGVEALERQGTKLYGAAPIPLLIWLLRGAAAETSKALPPVIIGSTGAGAAVIGGTLAAKIAAGIAAAVIVGGGVTAAVSRLDKRPATEPLTNPAFAFVETLPETQLFSIPSLPVITRAQTTRGEAPSTTAARTTAARTTTAINTTAKPVPATATTAGTSTAATTTTSTTTTTARTIQEDEDIWRVIYLLAVKMYLEDFPQDDLWQYWHFQPGSDYEAMEAQLIAFSYTVFPVNSNGKGLDYAAAYTAQKNRRLVTWARGVVTEINQIYARHLNQSGLAYLHQTLKPKQAQWANAAYLCETYYDSDYLEENLWSDPDSPRFNASAASLMDAAIDYNTRVWAFLGAPVPIPTGDPTEP